MTSGGRNGGDIGGPAERSRVLDLTALLVGVAQEALEAAGGDVAVIFLRDPASRTLDARCWVGPPLFSGAASGSALAGAADAVGVVVAAAGQPFRTADCRRDPRLAPELRESLKDAGPTPGVAIPIVMGGGVEGFLGVLRRSAEPFTEVEEEALLALAHREAPAVEAALRREETLQNLFAPDLLAQVARLVAGGADPGAVLRRICSAARTLFMARSAFFTQTLPDPGGLVLTACAGDLGPGLGPGTTFPPGIGLPGLVAARGRAVMTPDVVADPRVTLKPELRQALESAPDRAVLCVPVACRGDLAGTLSLRDRAGRLFSRRERRLAQALADHAAMALDSARLSRQSEADREAADRFGALGTLLARSADEREIPEAVCAALRSLLEARSAVFWELDPDSGHLVARGIAGRIGIVMKRGLAMPAGAGLPGLALAEGKPAMSADILADPRVVIPPDLRACYESADERASLCVPVLSREGGLGAICILDRRGRQFSKREARLAQASADQAAIALSATRLHADMARHRQAGDLLLEASRRLTESGEVEQLPAEICAALRGLLKVDGVTLWDRDPVSGDLVARAPDGASQGVPARRATQRDIEVRALLTLPLVVGGRSLGALTVTGEPGRRLAGNEVRLARIFAHQAAVLLEQARLARAAEERRREAELLAELVRDITAPLDLDTVLERIAAAARELCRGEAAWVGLRRTGGTVVAHRGSGLPEPSHLPVEPGKGAGGYVLATGRPFRTGDYGRDPRISRDYTGDTVSRGIVSMLVVPVGRGEQVEGLLYATSSQPDAFTDQDEVVLARLADYAALAVRNARRQQDATTHRGMLQALTDELSRLQEDERARLSREIHDELGQTLTGVRLALEAIQADLVDREPARTQARRAMEAVEEALREIRRITDNLRPFVLDFLGLTAALQRQAERVTGLTGLRVEVTVEGQPRRLHPQAETLLYRVAQEALTNVVKHAGARSARCQLRYGAASVELSILDDGSGFDPDEALDRGWREGRLGLVGLRERVQRGGGVFAVLSQPGRGTCVSVQLPTGAAGAESPGEATDAADPGPHR